MTREELIKYSSSQVRSNPNLLEIFIEFYKEDTGINPSCGGCAFNNNWDSFVKRTQKKNNLPKSKNMETEKKYKIHNELNQKIFTYYKDKKPYRIYGYQMTDAFAENYLSNGTKQELEDRIKQFKSYPKVSEAVKTDTAENTKTTNPKKQSK